jgi:hypothetical protein
MKADKNKAKACSQIDRIARVWQWIKWAFNQRDEVHERNREKGRYEMVDGKLRRIYGTKKTTKGE